MKFAICNDSCRPLSLEETCALAADCGYDGVEIAPFTLAESVYDLTPADRRSIRTTIEHHGLEAAGLHWLLAGPPDLHLNSPDPAKRRATVDYLSAEIDLCAEIGGRVLVFGSPQQRSLPPEADFDRAWERCAGIFRELGRRAEEQGVTFCIEPLGEDETNFISRSAQARRMVEDVDHPGFAMILDVKAMCWEQRPIPDIIRECAPQTAHFHANDANRQGPGFGDTDFRPIARALEEVGYDGYVSVEAFELQAGPERIARGSIACLRQAFSPAD